MLHWVIYSDRLIPAGYGGITYGPLIVLRPKYRGDRGILEHEKVHVRQFWCAWGLFPLFYFISKNYRLMAEVMAYREQLKYYEDDRTEQFATYLATKYRLGISLVEARVFLAWEDLP